MRQFDLHFHVKTIQGDKLLLLLQELTGIKESTLIKSAAIEKEDLLAGTDSEPDYLVVSQSAEDWYCIQHNSFKKLYSWGRVLSQELDTLFIQVAHRLDDGFCYFLAYERGQRLREIEATGLSEIPVLNGGTLFPFENPHADGISGYDIRMFDRDFMVDYCIECGVDLHNLHLSYYSQVFKKSV
ncbi:hypothetical protein HNQ91_002963 [Filimonas zeae]|uniref:Uncharacterized protein n=1 Tax=Filimonas zeae TaxID=1737353 RepID=A0A917J0C5_9BACT|nr:hypothetical protein [Filimonas zeae]MDR6339898.1 hypothetical protein [Filimonas zeae]GGH70203.1 hypothetical protein GCM10011379_28230 [Filimonas zeae]